jgi:DNA-binding NarL/FixJ family response regulator
MATFLIHEPRRAVRELLAARLAGLAAPSRPADAARHPSARPERFDVEWVELAEQLVPAYARRPAPVVLLGGADPTSNAARLTRQLLGVFPDASVIVLGAGADRDAQRGALAAGAHGFLRVDDLAGGDSAAGPPSAEPRAAHPSGDTTRSWAGISRREHQILVAMSRGNSNGEIAAELSVAEDTIKTHARRLYAKLEVNDRAAAVAAGFRRRLLH